MGVAVPPPHRIAARPPTYHGRFPPALMEFVRAALERSPLPSREVRRAPLGALAEREERAVGIGRRANDLVGEKELTGPASAAARSAPGGGGKSAETQETG
jgi:hypothetical protein